MRDLSLHILDIAQNSIRAKAKLVEIVIEEDAHEDTISLQIIDDGTGMDEETMAKVQDPFYTTRTTRKVGLGIPLLAQTARSCGGDFSINSGPRHGTAIKAVFIKSHIDMLPMGNMADTMVSLVAVNPNVDFVFKHKTIKCEFCFDTRDVKATLEDIPITLPTVLDWIREYIEQGLSKTCGGV